MLREIRVKRFSFLRATIYIDEKTELYFIILSQEEAMIGPKEAPESNTGELIFIQKQCPKKQKQCGDDL